MNFFSGVLAQAEPHPFVVLIHPECYEEPDADLECPCDSLEDALCWQQYVEYVRGVGSYVAILGKS